MAGAEEWPGCWCGWWGALSLGARFVKPADDWPPSGPVSLLLTLLKALQPPRLCVVVPWCRTARRDRRIAPQTALTVKPLVKIESTGWTVAVVTSSPSDAMSTWQFGVMHSITKRGSRRPPCEEGRSIDGWLPHDPPVGRTEE
ncbi:hypothetical protein KCMC57_up43450 [Kitasatospora sp. CMC57]